MPTFSQEVTIPSFVKNSNKKDDKQKQTEKQKTTLVN